MTARDEFPYTVSRSQSYSFAISIYTDLVREAQTFRYCLTSAFVGTGDDRVKEFVVLTDNPAYRPYTPPTPPADGWHHATDDDACNIPGCCGCWSPGEAALNP